MSRVEVGRTDDLLDPAAVGEAAARKKLNPRDIVTRPEYVVRHLVYALISTTPRKENSNLGGDENEKEIDRMIQNAYPRRALRPNLETMGASLQHELRNWSSSGRLARSIAQNDTWNFETIQEHVDRWVSELSE